MITRRMKQGFTLAELLVAVAIIAVLVAVAIPVFGGALEKARAATCLSNRTSLEHEVTYALMLADGSPDEVISQFTAQSISSRGYVCPEKGGQIQLSYDPVTISFSVFCKKHGGREVGYDFAGTVNSYMNGALGEKIVELLGSKSHLGQIDSSVPVRGNFAGPIKDHLSELTNHSLGLGMSATWSLCNINRSGKTIQKNYQIYWSSAKIAEGTSNQQILMMKYDAQTGQYSSGWVSIKTTSDSSVDGGKPYNVISPSTYQPLTDSASTDFMTAYQVFQAALEENSAGLQ